MIFPAELNPTWRFKWKEKKSGRRAIFTLYLHAKGWRPPVESMSSWRVRTHRTGRRTFRAATAVQTATWIDLYKNEWMLHVAHQTYALAHTETPCHQTPHQDASRDNGYDLKARLVPAMPHAVCATTTVSKWWSPSLRAHCVARRCKPVSTYGEEPGYFSYNRPDSKVTSR